MFLKLSEISPVSENELPEGWELVTLPSYATLTHLQPRANSDALRTAPAYCRYQRSVDAEHGANDTGNSRLRLIRKVYTSFREND